MIYGSEYTLSGKCSSALEKTYVFYFKLIFIYKLKEFSCSPMVKQTEPEL